MKKNLLVIVAVAVVAALGQTEAKAQIVNTTRINVVLADIMGTTKPGETPGTGLGTEEAGNNNGGETGPGGADPRAITSIVGFDYRIPQHYTADQTVERPGSINVISSREFQITVKAESQVFSYTGAGAVTENQKAIDVSAIRIAARPAGTANYGSPVTLQLQPASILQNQSSTANAGYDVQYTIPAAEAQKFISAKAGTHTVLVYYTITGI